MTWSPGSAVSSALASSRRELVWCFAIDGDPTIYTTGRVGTLTSWTSYVAAARAVRVELTMGDPVSGAIAGGRIEFRLLPSTAVSLLGTDSGSSPVSSLAWRRIEVRVVPAGGDEADMSLYAVGAIADIETDPSGEVVVTAVSLPGEMSRSVAPALGGGYRTSATVWRAVGASRIYVRDAGDIAAGDVVVIRLDDGRMSDHDVSAVGSEDVSGETRDYVDISPATEFVVPEGATVAKCWVAEAHPINIAARLLLDDWALTGTVQDDFPLTALRGAWGAGAGLGVASSDLDVAQIKRARDEFMSGLSGRLVISRQEADARALIAAMTAGLGTWYAGAGGLLRLAPAHLPAGSDGSRLVDDSEARAWSWSRDFVARATRVVVSGSILDSDATEVAVAVDADAEAAAGRAASELRARWLWVDLAAAGTIADTIAGRALARISYGPQTVELRGGDGLLTIEPGDVVLVSSASVPDSATGAFSAAAAYEVISTSAEQGAVVVRCRRPAGRRAAAITPDTAPAFASAKAEQVARYAYICENTGLMPDGSAGYVWV